MTRRSRVPVALLSVDLTLIKSALWSQKKPNIHENVSLNLLLQFLLPPQTNLSRLIKQPGLPGYCLCIWRTGLCQLSTCPPNNTTTPLLPNKAPVPTVWCPAGPTSAGLCSGWSRRTVTLHHPLAPTQHHHTHIYASIVPWHSFIFSVITMSVCEIKIHILLTLFHPCTHLWHHPVLIKQHIKLHFLTSAAWTTLECYLFVLISWWLLQAPDGQNLGDN